MQPGSRGSKRKSTRNSKPTRLTENGTWDRSSNDKPGLTGPDLQTMLLVELVPNSCLHHVCFIGFSALFHWRLPTLLAKGVLHCTPPHHHHRDPGITSYLGIPAPALCSCVCPWIV